MDTRWFTFVVRIVVEAGHLTGVVERVRTREKHRFHDVAMLGPLLDRMAQGEGLRDADTSGTAPQAGPRKGDTP